MWPATVCVCLWLFQKILLIQNPEPYLQHRKDNKFAVVVENATLSWTKPGSRSGSDQTGSTETLPTLRNISFKLQKVRLPTDAHA